MASIHTRMMHVALILIVGVLLGGCASTTSTTRTQIDESAHTTHSQSKQLQEDSCKIIGPSATEGAEQQTQLQELRPLADKGDVKAQYLLGAAYYQNPGTTVDDMRRNYQEAASWFRKSAEQGSADGQAAMGWLHEKGHGVLPDLLEASKWYRKAAKQGMAEAQYSLALLYHHGRGVNQNDDLAEKWYLQAAEQGHVCAQNNLGGLYEFRTLTLEVLIKTTTYKRGDPLKDKKYERAYIEAYKWYAIAASNNLRMAAQNRDKIEPRLTRTELAEAKKLAREWIDKHQQPR